MYSSGPRKKVVHLLYAGLGGHSAVFFALYHASRKSFFTHIPFFGGIEDLNSNNKDQCQQFAISFKYFKKKVGLDLYFYRQMIKALQIEKPDIIFLHGTGFFLPALIYSLFHNRARLVIRDTQAPHLKRRTDCLLLCVAHLVGKKSIFLTKESQVALSNRMGVFFRTTKSVIIPNGIDILKYDKQHHAVMLPRVNIGMQSRLQSIKDHPTLIKAFAGVIKACPNYLLRLHIAGDGTTASNLKALVADLGLNEHVRFWGMLDEKKLIGFLDEMDIYVHATFGETMSNSILQAMSCRLPIIASDVWGVNNMIRDGVSGLLYESENVTELTEKIVFLINNPADAERLKQAARSAVENEYSSAMMCRNYERVFFELI